MEPNLFDDSSMIRLKSSDYICRICFEGESEEFKLIIPCKCSGSMKYIHENCLKIWLLSLDKDLSTSECDICKSKFIMKIKLATKCTCKNYSNELQLILILLVINILLTIFSSLLLTFLLIRLKTKTSSIGEIIYLSLLLLVFGTINTTTLVIFISKLKKGLCSSEIVYWNINSLAQEQKLEETGSPVTPTLHNDEIKVMVMPKFLRHKGRNITMPEILTPNLCPIMKSGELVAYKARPATARSAAFSQSFITGMNVENNYIYSKIVTEP